MPLAPKWSDQSNADILAAFLQADGGSALQDDSGMRADDALAAGSLRHTRDMENRERMVNDPTNPRYQMVDKFINQDEAADPYSQSSSLARMSKAQDATDVMQRFLSQQGMRDQQAIDAGTMAQSVGHGKSLGEHTGEFEADVSPVGLQALSNKAKTEIEIARLKAVNAHAAANPAMGGAIQLPDGVTMDSLGSGNPNDMTKSDFAKDLFLKNNTDPGSQALVQAILDYRLGGPAMQAQARSGHLQQLMALAATIDKNFQPARYDAGRKLYESVTSGELASKLASLNRYADHMQHFEDARKALHNSGMSETSNMIGNFINRRWSGDQAPAAFDNLAHSVANEKDAFLIPKGSTSTDASRANALGGLSSSSLDGDIQGWADSSGHLVNGQVNAFRNELSGFPGLQREFDRQIMPHTQAVLSGQRDRTQNGPAAPPFPPANGMATGNAGVNPPAQVVQQFMNGQAAAPAASAPAAANPSPGTKGIVNGIPAIWNGVGWVRDRSVR